jgi:hypothetical protein
MDANEKRPPEEPCACGTKTELRMLVAGSPNIPGNSRPFVFIRGFFCGVPVYD